MKKIIILLTTCFLPLLACAQWQWAKKIGSNYNIVATPFSSDSNNNIYVSGYFQYEARFQTDTLYSNGYTDMFLAKYDQNGNETWIKKIGGNNPFHSFEKIVAHVDNSGNNIIAVGTYYDTLSIDGHTVASVGGSDIFIASFDLNGHCNWLKSAGGLGNDIGKVFTIDYNNDIFLTCTISDTIGYFDTFSVSRGDAFVKYNPNGNCIFAQIKYSGINISDIKPIGMDLIVSGYLSDSTVVFDTIIKHPSQSSAILASMDTLGNVHWLKLYGGGYVFGLSVGIDAHNYIYYTGHFEDSITFNSFTITHYPGTTKEDYFLAKLDNNGNAIWVRQSNSTDNAHGIAILPDFDGNTYLAGDFSGTAQFGNFTISANTNSDYFLARYGPNGDCLGVRHFGVAISLKNIITDSNNSVIVGGQFINNTVIGSTNLQSTNSINPDVFIAKSASITGLGGDGHRVNNNLLIYANPMEGKCTISVPDELLNEAHLVLSIFDSNGKLIQQRELERFEGKVRLNLEAEAKGVYTAVLSSGSKSYSGKIVFE